MTEKLCWRVRWSVPGTEGVFSTSNARRAGEYAKAQSCLHPGYSIEVWRGDKRGEKRHATWVSGVKERKPKPPIPLLNGRGEHVTTRWQEWMGDVTIAEFLRQTQTRMECYEELVAQINLNKAEMYREIADEIRKRNPNVSQTTALEQTTSKWKELRTKALEDLLTETEEERERLATAINANLRQGCYCKVTHLGMFRVDLYERVGAVLDFSQAEALLTILEKGHYQPTPAGMGQAIADAKVVSAGRGGA